MSSMRTVLTLNDGTGIVPFRSRFVRMTYKWDAYGFPCSSNRANGRFKA